MATDLAFWNWAHPCKDKIDANAHSANDPNRLRIILSTLRRQIEAEHQSKDDATKVATGASEARHDTIIRRKDVWHIGKVEAVGAVHEESDERDEPEHGAVVVGVELADDDEEGAHDGDVAVEEDALGPDAVCFLVDEVGDDATKGTEDNVEETEHCDNCQYVAQSLIW